MAEDTNPSTQKSFWLRPWALLLLGVVGALLLFFGITGMRIVRAAGEGPAKNADVIAIFGAAEYAGRPSPVYRAHSIGAWLRRRNDEAKEEVLKITGELAGIAEVTVADALAIARNAKRSIVRAGKSAPGKAVALVGEIEQ